MFANISLWEVEIKMKNKVENLKKKVVIGSEMAGN